MTPPPTPRRIVSRIVLLVLAVYALLALVLPSDGAYERLEPVLGRGFLLALAGFVGARDPLHAPLLLGSLLVLTLSEIASLALRLAGGGTGEVRVDASGAIPLANPAIRESRERLKRFGFDVRMRSEGNAIAGDARRGSLYGVFDGVARAGLALSALALLVDAGAGFAGEEVSLAGESVSIPATSFETPFGRRFGPEPQLRADVRRLLGRVRLLAGRLDEPQDRTAFHRTSDGFLDLGSTLISRYAAAIAEGRLDIQAGAVRGSEIRAYLARLVAAPADAAPPEAGSAVLAEAAALHLSPSDAPNLAEDIRTIAERGGRASSLALDLGDASRTEWRSELAAMLPALERLAETLDRVRDAVAIPDGARLPIRVEAVGARYDWARALNRTLPPAEPGDDRGRVLLRRLAAVFGFDRPASVEAWDRGFGGALAASPDLLLRAVGERHSGYRPPPPGWVSDDPEIVRTALAALVVTPRVALGDGPAQEMAPARAHFAGAARDVAWSVAGARARVVLALGPSAGGEAPASAPATLWEGRETSIDGRLRVSARVLLPGEGLAEGGSEPISIPLAAVLAGTTPDGRTGWCALQPGESGALAGVPVHLVSVDPGVAIAYEVAPARGALWAGGALLLAGIALLLPQRRTRVRLTIGAESFAYRVVAEGILADPAEAEDEIDALFADLVKAPPPAEPAEEAKPEEPPGAEYEHDGTRYLGVEPPSEPRALKGTPAMGAAPVPAPAAGADLANLPTEVIAPARAPEPPPREERPAAREAKGAPDAGRKGRADGDGGTPLLPEDIDAMEEARRRGGGEPTPKGGR